MRRTVSVIAAFIAELAAVGLFAAGAANGATPTVQDRALPALAPLDAALAALDDPSPDLADAANGWTVQVGLTNLTRSVLQLAVNPGVLVAKDCTLTPTPVTLPASQHDTVKVAVPDSCAVKDGLSFTITATAIGTTVQPQALVVTAKRPTTTPVDWKQLRAFPIALVALGLIGLVLGLVVSGRNNKNAAGGEKVTAEGTLGKLPYLDSAWSFSDSWLNNITAGAGLLTGIVGSTDVAKALLGADADSKVRLGIVGAAIAVALIAAAPLVLGIFQPPDGTITIVGLFLAAAVSISAALGALWVMGRTAQDLDVPWLSANAKYIAIAAIVLVLIYAWVSLYGTVISGLTKPDDPPESDTLKAATVVASAIRRTQSRGLMQKLQADPDSVVIVDDKQLHQADTDAQDTVNQAMRRDPAPTRRRRSALL